MHILLAALAAAVLQATPMPSTPPATTPATAPAPTSGPLTATAPVNRNPAAAQPSFGEVVSSVNRLPAVMAQIRAMNGGSANMVRPVNVSALTGADPTALSNAVSRNQAQVASLRSALNKVTVTTPTNERITLAQFLADNKISASQIISAEVNNGTLLLFYQKP